MAGGYQELVVWQKAMDFAVECYRVTKDFPAEEKFGLVSQLRRAASSIAANIAEGHGRQTDGAFVQFLRMSQGSLREAETHIQLSQRVGLVSEDAATALIAQSNEIGKMLNGLIKSRAT